MKICKDCGNELLEGITVCPYCGWFVQDYTESQNIELDVVYAVSEKVKRKGKGKAVLIAVIALIIGVAGRMTGGYVGELTTKNFIESIQKKGIEEFIESTEKYVPGYRSGNEYVSEKFGFRFVTDENWEYYSDEDLQAASEGVKANAINSGLAAIENEDISPELKNKWAESVYAATEFGALYIADEMYVGDVTVGVMSVFGIENMSDDEYVNAIKSGINAEVQVDDEFIAGSTYKVLSAKITDINGIDTTAKMYIKTKDSMICMITCRAMDGYEEQVFKAFEEGISVYE